MNGRASYLAVGLAAILVVVFITSLSGCTRMGGMSKSEVDKKLSKAGFFIDHAEPTSVDASGAVTTRAYYPTTANGAIVVHGLKYRDRQMTDEVRLSLKPAAPVIAKFYYQFDGKPIITQVLDPNASEYMVDHARKEFERIVTEFTK